MTSAELLVDAFGRIRGVVHRVVDGLSPGQLAVRVDPAANSIAWLVWHLTRIQDDHLADAFQAEQVWTFTRNLAVPWTNNASEQALKGPKRHQAVSGYWHTVTTLAGYCRVRSYLVSARNHGIRAIEAIHAALAGKPWLPAPTT